MNFIQFWQQAWFLIKPFWLSKKRYVALLWLVIILSCAIFEVYMAVRLTEWNGGFYNNLQNYDQHKFFASLVSGSIIMLLFVFATIFTYYSSSILEIKWRKWLTKYYLQAWIKSHSYYFSEFIKHNHQDNPDQRISDDVHQFVNLTIKILITSFRSIISLGSFLVILWQFSGNFLFNIASHSFYVPGYMVWLALLYAGIGTYITFKIGNPLIKLNYQQQCYEANFRYNLVRIREYSQQIAAYKGAAIESQHATRDFNHIVDNFMQILRRNFKINMFNYTYGQISTIIPTLISAGRYFARKITLGDMMQINSAFARVQFAVAFLIYMYADIATWRAVMNRLSDFMCLVDESTKLARQSVHHHDSSLLIVNNLSIYNPTGSAMIKELSFEVNSAEHILFVGETGCGKSSLFKALNGLWPYASGLISERNGIKSLFIAQRPYLPLFNLKEAICYPLVNNLPSDIEIKQLMLDCKLDALLDKLYTSSDWSKMLSIGEQQKIIFCRVLINKPDIVYLDESSSALDRATELKLYNLLHSQLPQLAILTISHNNQLRQLHKKIITIA